MTNTFKELAKQENAVFNQVDNKYLGDRGSFVHSSTYTLECNYRNVVIELKNELGHQNIGRICCHLETQPSNCEFTIDTRGALFQFLNRNKNALKFEGENPQLRNFIELNEAFDLLNLRARKDRFEPLVTGRNIDGRYQISCQYHLVFNNKELVISPFIRFFKVLIDFFLDHLMRYN